MTAVRQQMEEAEQYCFEDFESEHASAHNGAVCMSNINQNEKQLGRAQYLGERGNTRKTKSNAILRRNLSEEESETGDEFDYNRVVATKMALRGSDFSAGKSHHGGHFEPLHQFPKTFNAKGDLISGLSFGNSGINKKSRYLKNTPVLKKQREWRKPKLFTKATYLHRTLSDGSGVPEENTGMSNDLGMYPGSMGNLESKSVEDRLQQLSQEDKLSVRTRPDFPHGSRGGGLGQKGKFRPGRQNSKDFRSRDYLFREESIYSPLKSKPMLQTLSMSEDQLDKRHPLFVNGASLDNMIPLEDPPPQVKGQSLPSEIDRITLFGPRDLIASQGSLSSHKETDEDLSSSSQSTESILSRNGNKFKRRPLTMGSDTPDFVETLLGLPPREKQKEREKLKKS
ncbi:hypothetical protein HOLleu_18665 [Holothuria leucospilota]|uniref:Uncharacterized protein n=1 Tax=Holothuria leucospilota TaxID=206669 RepID=A0A9Q1H9V1_HOLLE|nr:hypothetical protein HOLleu_18665 [Holothuria leucospilota]